jgi:alkylation response protein AidB-like acyl-CoA dehydrogenase
MTISAAERTALRAAVRDLLRDGCTEQDVRNAMNSGAGFDRGLWRRLAELGLAGLLIDPGYGGSGLGPLELEAVAEETGAALLPAPFIASGVLAASLIQAAGTPEDRQRLLPGIAAGTSIATVAVTGRRGSWTPDGVDVTAAAGQTLTGEARYVTFGQAADVILVAARAADGIGVFEVAPDAAGFTRTAQHVFDPTVRLSAYAFDAVPARRLGTAGWDAVQHALDLALIALAGEQAGGARRVFDRTVEYLKTRVQFGRFIGSFQALKHLAADLLLEVESATSAARYAAAQYAAAPEAAGAVALAGFACAEAFETTALHAIQLHGGIAFTWEHPAHLFLRRARSGARLFGGPRALRERYLVSKECPAISDPASAASRGGEPSAQELGAVVPGAAELRAEVRDWLARHWTGLPSADGGFWGRSAERTAWLAAVLDAGYAVPTWPAGWGGRGYPNELADVIEGEFAAAGAPGARQDKHNIAANTALKFGTERLKRDIVTDVLTGRATTCLLYSEPGAGSDLAAVRTTAVKDGDRWVVNGQKVWTSGAATADYALLIARTDWDVPKHRGLSYFVLPMRQPGIDVRPLVQITGESHFNEVFITDASLPGEYLVGAEGDGWRVLQTALAYERSVMGDAARASRHHSLADDLIGLAREHGQLDDPVLRYQLAKVLALRELNGLNNARAKAAAELGTSSPLMSLGKLAMADILHAEARLRTEIAGPLTLLAGAENPEADDINFLMLNAFFTSIGGGTSQIQRNIIAERVLGLPKEPEVDRNIPFRSVRRS